MSELLPCPFCGGEAKLISADHPSYTQHSDGWYVICDCGASLGYHGNDGNWETYGDFPHELCAITAWNTRAERTCHKVIPNEESGYVFCSECGAEIGEYSVPNYCHMCGAKVVEHG